MTPSQDDSGHPELGELVLELGLTVRRHILQARDRQSDHEVVGFQGGDTVYGIDKLVEPLILAKIERWPEEVKPLTVIAEGLEGGSVRIGDPYSTVRYRVLIDPIDGTRGLMYDKRSAWFLAAIAPDSGTLTRVSESTASAIVELPTSKQALADEYVALSTGGLVGRRRDLRTERTNTLSVQPSREPGLAHGFGQVSNFFPGTKRLAADLMEHIADRVVGPGSAGQALVFEDQYISTGGQFVELFAGHDRFCCDLRPLFYQILAQENGRPVTRGLECHPYDIAGLLVAQRAGVILTDGRGNPLDASFSLEEPVHWCGYANSNIRAQIEPAIQEWLALRLRTP